MGSKVRYNVTAIKAAIKKHPAFFGGGRDYAFRDKVALTEAQKINRRFKHIAFMVKLGEPVTGQTAVGTKPKSWTGKISLPLIIITGTKGTKIYSPVE